MKPRHALVALGLMSIGCSQEGTTAESIRHAPPEAIPATIAIPSNSRVALGTRMRDVGLTVAVDAFAITKHVISVAQWKQCMRSGPCAEPVLETGACEAGGADGTRQDGPTFDRGNDDVPVTCVSFEQAQHYCR